MYPVYLNAAEFHIEADAKRSFHFALEAEKLHVVLFQKALDAVNAGKDIDLKANYVCFVCKHTIVDEVPDNCPVCGAKK